ncbi:hypothetical protein BH23BAC1_BH23BAC1_09690 [soil metagenome]
MKITIGITETSTRFENYPPWIIGDDEAVEIIQLSYSLNNLDDIKFCDGVVLSGGVDSHPRFYNSSRLTYPNAPSEFNEVRDEFELQVFEYTQKNKMPVLAVCRGMQLVNIAFGGGIMQDLEEAGNLDHRRHERDGIHKVRIIKDTLLFEVTGSETGEVNSAHHQGLSVLAENLLANAYSPDSVIEGIEWREKAGKAFFLGVQWHPERLALEQPDNSLTQGIRKKFIEAVKLNKNENY